MCVHLLFKQGSKEELPALSMKADGKGQLLVDFHARLSALQAFSACISLLHCSEASTAVVIEKGKHKLYSSSLKMLLEGEVMQLIEAVTAEEKKKLKHVRQEEEVPAATFPEDALMEILSRVPCRPLCRFKCVSKEWLALCSYSHTRKKSPQAMSGFFYKDHGLRFHNLSGKGPPMVDPDRSFLRSSYKHFCVTQCSTRLLLC